MPRGGARYRSGPAPDPNSLRSDRAGWVHLPAAGRPGEPPAWPLDRPTKFELETWAAEWRRPQAIMWERRGWELQVAIYVRNVRRAMAPKASASLTNGLERQMVNLGLTEAGLARNRWIIDDPIATSTTAPRRASGSSAKDRLAVIQGGADAQAS